MTASGTGFLAREGERLAALVPGLRERLADTPLFELERESGEAIAAFKASAGPALLVPKEHGGVGATAPEAISVQRAIASRAPSLAIASTMHHFSVATLSALSRRPEATHEWMLLEAIAEQRLLIASGFAEGRSGQSILAPYLTSTPTGSGYRLRGSKKPCSLSSSMDLLTASVRASEDGREYLAVAIIPATAPGIERRPFWTNCVLAGAESHEVVLNDVEVDSDLLILAGSLEGDGLGDLELVGLIWFELLITASYLGIASALAERAIAEGRGDPTERAALAIDLEGPMMALQGAAYELEWEGATEGLLARLLMARYLAQGAAIHAASQAMEMLGGMAFMRSSECTYLAAATRALAFHPPSRARTSPALVAFLDGEPLRIE